MAKIDTNQIDGYKEMTPEEKIKALESYDVEDLSSELERYKNAVSKSNSEAAEWKRKHNALLSEDEQKQLKAEEEMNNIRTELETLRGEKLKSDHIAKLIALGYEEDLASKTAEALVQGETESVFAYQKQHQENLEKKIRADVLVDTPKPRSGSGTEADIKKEQFNELGYTERMKIYNDSPELYKQLIGGENV